MKRFLLIIVLSWVILPQIKSDKLICRRVKSLNILSQATDIIENSTLENGFVSMLKLKTLMVEVCVNESDEVKTEIISYLEDIARFDISVHKRKAALYGIKELFPYLSSDMRVGIADYFCQHCKITENFVNVMRPYSSIELLPVERIGEGVEAVAAFIPQLNQDEIKLLNKELVEEVALYCARSMLSSRVQDLSKIIRFLDSDAQSMTIKVLMDNFSDEEDRAYKEDIGIDVTACIVDNMSNFSSEVLNEIYEFVGGMLMSTDEVVRGIGVGIGTGLLDFISDSDRKRQLKLFLSLAS